MDTLEASSHAGQVSDSDHSDTGESDIDISGLLQVSDQNSPASSSIVKKYQNITNAGQVSRSHGEGGRQTLSRRMTSAKLFCLS